MGPPTAKGRDLFVQTAFEAPPGCAPHGLLKTLLAATPHGSLTPRIRLALRFLFPLDAQWQPRADEASLTDAVTFPDQLRFYNLEHARRHWRILAQHLHAVHGSMDIHVHNCLSLDEGSRDFIATVARSGIQLAFTLTAESAPGTTLLPTEDERASRPPEPTPLTRARDHLNVGDAWTTLALSRSTLHLDAQDEAYFLAGMALVMLERPGEAEPYYLRWRESGDQARIRANYVLAMLHARHLPRHLGSLSQAQAYLDEAGQLLDRQPDKDTPEGVFRRIFNDNGAALVAHLRGDHHAALELVLSGLHRLQLTGPKEALHQAVLLYNAAVCHQTLGQTDKAIAAFHRLIALDPRMPDHHLKLARFLLNLDNPADALPHIKEALTLDGAFTEAHSLHGYALRQLGRPDAAEDAYRRAFHLDHAHPVYAYDLAYVLTEDQRHHEADHVLRRLTQHVPAGAITTDTYSLIAENHLATRGPRAAAETLTTALQHHPNHPDLSANLRTVHALVDRLRSNDDGEVVLTWPGSARHSHGG